MKREALRGLINRDRMFTVVDSSNGDNFELEVVSTLNQLSLREPAELKPWDKLPEESDLAWSAFQTFRDLDPSRRTVKEAHRTWYRKRHGGDPPNNQTPAMFTFWARRFNWRRRADAYTIAVDQVAQQAFTAARARAVIRQAEEGFSLQELGMRILGMKTEEQLAREPISALVGMVEAGVRIERTAMGEPESFTGKSPHSNSMVASGLETMTPEERLLLGRLSRKAAGISSPYDTEDEEDDCIY